MTTPNDTTIRFRLDGETVEASGLPATTTVLEWLRDHAGRTGTKEGCAEGDCGACTVVLGERDDGDGVRYRAVNSCIRFLPTIDGKELLTVESLQAPNGTLHPVQRALVDCHGSQCGFCTPGFVMSLLALYLDEPAPTRERVLDALAGNLCRCTGYRPIVEAARCAGAYPEPARWSRADAADAARRRALDALARDADLHLPDFHAPRSLTALADAVAATPDALLLAGATDIGLWVNKDLRTLPPLIYLGEVPELQRIVSDPDGLHIGAAVPLSSAWPALVTQRPALAEVAQRFASPPVCNSGTLVGNIANGSPIGDSMPALIACGARITLRHGDHQRELPLEDFYLGYQRKDLTPGEFVEAVHVPPPAEGERTACYKLAKRFDQDISAVCLGIRIVHDGERIGDARLAFGGMAATPARARHAEAALRGQPLTEAAIEAAVTALAHDFAPIGDMRASEGYRLRAAGNLLRRFLLEQAGATVRLAAVAV
ncbi:xanthine dehydrogenase small subunit [Algiphilus sp.]|uniref:xanthine dehydrogenase small subunit n=1 Tax=Algiphilus sp. TaxID=1872431 RepID=UPI0025BC1A46|nr:xanthine dehydrogenase small subunit [Algiphilus sp.]MCK5768738.1 xanthine dehydrogenase small subunit [Algiphilus sp.]